MFVYLIALPRLQTISTLLVCSCTTAAAPGSTINVRSVAGSLLAGSSALAISIDAQRAERTASFNSFRNRENNLETTCQFLQVEHPMKQR